MTALSAGAAHLVHTHGFEQQHNTLQRRVGDLRVCVLPAVGHAHKQPLSRHRTLRGLHCWQQTGILATGQPTKAPPAAERQFHSLLCSTSSVLINQASITDSTVQCCCSTESRIQQPAPGPPPEVVVEVGAAEQTVHMPRPRAPRTPSPLLRGRLADPVHRVAAHGAVAAAAAGLEQLLLRPPGVHHIPAAAQHRCSKVASAHLAAVWHLLHKKQGM